MMYDMGGWDLGQKESLGVWLVTRIAITHGGRFGCSGIV